MTTIVGGFNTLAFNEGAFNARGGILRTNVGGVVASYPPAVFSGDVETAAERIWLKPEPVIYIPRECTES